MSTTGKRGLGMEELIILFIFVSVMFGTSYFIIKYNEIMHPSYYDNATFAETLFVGLIGFVLSPLIFPIAIIVGFRDVCKKIIEVIEENKCQK